MHSYCLIISRHVAVAVVWRWCCLYVCVRSQILPVGCNQSSGRYNEVCHAKLTPCHGHIMASCGCLNGCFRVQLSYAFAALTRRKGQLACKNLTFGLWLMVIWQELCIQFCHHQLHLVSLSKLCWKRAVKMSVVVVAFISTKMVLTNLLLLLLLLTFVFLFGWPVIIIIIIRNCTRSTLN